MMKRPPESAADRSPAHGLLCGLDVVETLRPIGFLHFLLGATERFSQFIEHRRPVLFLQLGLDHGDALDAVGLSVGKGRGRARDHHDRSQKSNCAQHINPARPAIWSSRCWFRASGPTRTLHSPIAAFSRASRNWHDSPGGRSAIAATRLSTVQAGTKTLIGTTRLSNGMAAAAPKPVLPRSE